MFDNLEFLLHNMSYFPKHKKTLFSKSMFDDIGFCARVKHGVLKILCGASIMAKGSKVCGLYI